MGGIFRRPVLLIGLVVTLALVGVALLSLVWTPSLPSKMNIVQRLKPPLGPGGLFGTDQFGRDVASMLMVGAWNSLSTSFLAVAIGATVGSAVGVIVAMRRGWLELIVMRGCDIIFAVPPILSAMMLGAFLGSGRFTAIIAIAVFMVPVFARLTLAGAKQIWARDYVTAAVGIGRSKAKITLVHILPNISNQIIVQVTIQLGLAILTEAGLSFLGLGMPPPAPTWGRMLADSQTFFGQAPWLAILPGMAIAVAVLGLNMLGDGLRDMLDPKTKAG
ncbi:peptide ABC transporter permease [Rhizobium wenxiniae]|uniref:Peptide/nickel transport system permease protein n=1 Tax=Rhizobium wenxiniae TaxID=1737357 RepID=A0A7W9Y425_9HYPH|nr:ABC transporter permease [Rhizobium wenxiniae]MBB6161610.1 peptide/nickel transport system permease protein [Rhizobium wenxiniae]GGF90175.1 peptide ABC transporter permease [Rhizobium wenxiniae]